MSIFLVGSTDMWIKNELPLRQKWLFLLLFLQQAINLEMCVFERLECSYTHDSKYILALCKKDILKRHLWEGAILTAKILMWYKYVILAEIKYPKEYDTYTSWDACLTLVNVWIRWLGLYKWFLKWNNFWNYYFMEAFPKSASVAHLLLSELVECAYKKGNDAS